MQFTQLESKVTNGIRLNPEEGLALYDLPLYELARLGDFIKRKKFGRDVTYLKNYYLSFTNVCKYACNYCGFRRNPNDSDAYTLNLDQIKKKILAAPEKLSEVWFSSGLNASLEYSFYIDLIKAVKQVAPDAALKAFTAVEIDFISKHFKKSHEEVLDDFISAGLDRIPGGGAEIFDDKIRKKMDIKTRHEDYLRIHELCHKRDVPTSITMLFGHVESRSHRIKHLDILRNFQDRSGGVQAFIPLAYQDKNNPLAKRGIKGPSPVEILKTLAVSRIYLDNIDHIQSFWIDSGEETTQISLHFGVDDVNGTMIEETIAHESGARSATYQPSDKLVDWIKSAECIPKERDFRFNLIPKSE